MAATNTIFGYISDRIRNVARGADEPLWEVLQVPDEHDSEFTEPELSEFDEEIIEALKLELAALSKPTSFEELNQTKSKKDWKKVEATRNERRKIKQPFLKQKSLVQEVIEAAGHLSIFLPKFHCELNFIEFFWRMVKKYLSDNWDYTFDTLKENMPKALTSVKLATIRCWEHRMVQWMDAYHIGMET
ncbi:hypothetical protein B0H17DRAFT_1190450 [Mycena rosella]|uniref:Uncharacterized protein n=1 Tax=Mycena rosella TaxID=1033263 RepID=A0AAD7H3S0_MYCRO|nr:hypothetical protein B0H17DRAFT_1190450 [Mycena rosella]